jgi:hypothetical protein
MGEYYRVLWCLVLVANSRELVLEYRADLL